jgi:ABC-type bacteriocin/lantibiotic exporter with double-glycine peptidase domain
MKKMLHSKTMVWIMTALSTAACTLWFPHHFLGDSQYLNSEGVFFQQTHSDCGSAALKMVFDRLGIPMEYGRLLQRLQPGPEGTTMLRIKEAAESEGLRCMGWRLSFRDLTEIPLPAVLLLRRRHFVVLEGAEAKTGIYILDPVRGRLRLSARKLRSIWEGETLLFCLPKTNGFARWFPPNATRRL